MRILLVIREGIREFLLVMTSQRIKKLKKALASKGWSQRAAAKEIGRTFEHVNRVLQGHRESEALLAALESLPAREVAQA